MSDVATTAVPVRRLRARSLGRASQAPAEVVHLLVLNEPIEDYDRPQTRADCASVPRPCPFVGCKYHLYLDVNRDNGSIRLNFPDQEPSDLPADRSCVLDMADDGGATLEHSGNAINLTRERIRQVEEGALAKARNPRTSNPRSDPSPALKLRDFEGHESHGFATPLGAAMLEPTASDMKGGEEPEQEHDVTGLPHILDERLSDEDYSSAIHRIWDRWREDRKALARGELHVVGDHYVSSQQLRVIDAIRASWIQAGRAPSLDEIVQAAKVQGSSETGRRQNASSALRILRDLGLITGARGELRVVEPPAPAQTPAEAQPAPETVQSQAQEQSESQATGT